MRNLSKMALGLASMAAITAALPASAALVTDPDDPRTWQGATVGTFAALYYGSNTPANRQLVVDNQLLDDGLINTAGWVAGSLLPGSGGLGGVGSFGCVCVSIDSTGTGSYGYGGGGSMPFNANAIDEYWFQTASELAFGVPRGITTGGTIYDMGFSANKAAIFNSIDHGPLPEEAIESTVYLSNDVNFATFVQGVVERVYLEGFMLNTGILWDGFSYIVGTGTSDTFRYASVAHGGPGALYRDGDNEINGIMGLQADNTGCTIGVDCDNPGDSVPEPITLSLFGAGLLGIGALRRRRA